MKNLVVMGNFFLRYDLCKPIARPTNFFGWWRTFSNYICQICRHICRGNKVSHNFTQVPSVIRGRREWCQKKQHMQIQLIASSWRYSSRACTKHQIENTVIATQRNRAYDWTCEPKEQLTKNHGKQMGFSQVQELTSMIQTAMMNL